ncbi:hypothetical protein K450DRAFT_283248 [Umbelopsis ramanniana AG]|uniref:Uncharacterized protein n=1 Tax=Umbelopsis ramanniana AG TaxID=1314678 RepID=A0AAD5E4Q8_UMBRA|nr:uncharacterized protein K450DRAFT_283248 [Umbelopsis ramanniana AG]KAI8576702.1 hypothetical protein K450DRAFT_283248 [Umbelopsis ramanniana AG]
MSEKNQPLGSHVSDHGYENIPPPPAYTALSSSPTAPAMKSDAYPNNAAPPYEASRGYGRPPPNDYAPPQQYNVPVGQYTPPPQQYNAPPGQYSPPTQQYGGPYETSSGGFQGGMFGTSKLKRKPLDPPPPCLSRPPQFFQRPLPFAAFRIPCSGSHLDSGFPLMYPGHVLHGHDIQELEWIRFLEDLGISGRLESGEKVKSHILPMAFGVGAAGILISRAMQRRMKNGKANQVGSLVDIWNGYYFHLRGVNVTLMHGDKALSGLQASELTKDSSSSCSSDSSSDEESLRHSPSQYQQQHTDRRQERKIQREEKRERRDQRREEKRERRDLKREERRARKQERKEGKRKDIPYYLIVESRPM